jgi:hypothetical protein
MLQYRLYGGQKLPANLEGFMKAGANIGSVIGQFAFGYAADALGRKAVCTWLPWSLKHIILNGAQQMEKS